MTMINTNNLSIAAQRNLMSSQSEIATSIQRLSTGLRINSAKDDAAGMAIAQRMTSQLRGMEVAQRNANDAVSLAQTAEGALGKVSEMFQRMRELSVQASNATLTSSDRTNLDLEFQQLGQEVVRTLAGTRFNGLAILGASAGSQTFQVGDQSTDTITATTTRLDNNASVTAVTGGNITTAANATTAMGNIDTAITLINTQRSTYGALQNRFEATIDTLGVQIENLGAARSRITDTDYAKETANLTRAQVLQQAGVAMLSQANAAPQSVLALLR
jgi:flagellin